jgi:hypothetical protein
LPGEPPKAYAAFCVYRDLGPNRSLDQAGWRIYPGTQTGRKRGATGRIREWADWWRWAQRAAAWDAALEASRRARFVQASEAIAERQAAAAALFQQQVAEQLGSMTGKDNAWLSPKDLIQWFCIAVQVERQARGLPAEINLKQHGRARGRGKNKAVHCPQDCENTATTPASENVAG